MRLGGAVLLVGGALYLVLQFPDDTKRAMPIEGSYPFVNAGLLVLLLVLIAALINYVRGLGQNDRLSLAGSVRRITTPGRPDRARARHRRRGKGTRGPA